MGSVFNLVLNYYERDTMPHEHDYHCTFWVHVAFRCHTSSPPLIDYTYSIHLIGIREEDWEICVYEYAGDYSG